MGDLEIVDLGNGFFLVRFANADDAATALTEGQWLIGNHYLTVSRWTPGFTPSTATIMSTTVWVRLPELPIEYYYDDVLYAIGKSIEVPLKVDYNTSLATRGRFARICVELDLQKPLVSRYWLDGIRFRVKYEGLPVICFTCGCVGHQSTDCPISVIPTNGTLAHQPVMQDTVAMDQPETRYGPWIQASKRVTRGKAASNIGVQSIAASGGQNRFAPLQEGNGIDSRLPADSL
ncbi:hypothetical protein L1049_019875 [Liquidambar formosana]|uniref:CCHC-type domain-containing protein n=1 Tax=Liquidambar formosana TaxID=63359 RepID=A0AAP0X9G9_LIQFO